MQKRGGRRGEAALSDSIFVLLDLTILVVVGFLIFSIAKTQVTNPAVDVYRTAADLALRMEALAGVPGSAAMLYQSAAPFKAKIATGEDVAVEAYPPEGQGRKYLFHKDRFLDLRITEITTNEPTLLQKGGNRLSIQPLRKAQRIIGPLIPIVDTKGSRENILLIAEGDTAQQAASFVLGEEIMQEAAQLQTANIVVVFSPGNAVRIWHVPDSKSRKLAALTVSELSQDVPLIPISFSYLAAGDPKRFLSGKIGVLIEFPEQEAQAFGQAIDRGLDAYFRPIPVIEPAKPIGEVEVIGNAMVIAP